MFPADLSLLRAATALQGASVSDVHGWGQGGLTRRGAVRVTVQGSHLFTSSPPAGFKKAREEEVASRSRETAGNLVWFGHERFRDSRPCRKSVRKSC